MKCGSRNWEAQYAAVPGAHFGGGSEEGQVRPLPIHLSPPSKPWAYTISWATTSR